MSEWQPDHPAPLANLQSQILPPNETVSFDTEVETLPHEPNDSQVREAVQTALKQVLLWVLEGNVTHKRYLGKVLRKLFALAWYLKVHPFDTSTFVDAFNGEFEGKKITKLAVFKYAHELQIHFGIKTPPR